MIHLYIKRHNVTGMQYFGKVTKRDPLKYKGSGKYWLRHIRKHGNDVTTEILGSFERIEDAENTALQFSKDNDIANNPSWANLIDENARDGAPVGHPGHVFTEEQRKRMSEKSSNRWADPAYRERIVAAHVRRWTPERKAAQGARLRGKKRPEHSAKLKGRKATDAFLQFVRSPRSEQHKAAISAALTGRSSEHTAGK